MKILLIGTFASAGRPLLERFLQVPNEVMAFPGRFDERHVIKEIRDAEVVVGAPFTNSMGQSARQLRLIQNTGVGVDRYDLSSFPPGVRLCVSAHHGAAMAEYVIMVILAMTRRLLPFDSQFRQGKWDGSCIFNPLFTTRQLTGRTLGLVGYGTIAKEIAGRASALGLRVQAVKQNRSASAPPPGIDFLGGPADLHRLLAAADYLVVTCPLTPETDGLIGERELGLMKPDSYLINVSRAKIIREGPLYEALRRGQIAGAALDVWYNYPPGVQATTCFPSTYPFHELPNVIMTPHISSCTVETIEARWRDIAYNIEHLEAGSELRNEVQWSAQGAI